MSSLRLAFHLRAIAGAVFFLMVTFAHAAPLDIDLPAQALTTSIQQLSLQSGLSIGGDAALLEGKTAPAVKGNMEPADALRQLLQGSGLSVSFAGNKAIIGTTTPVLKEVVIESAIPKEGSAEVGYKPSTAKTTGPWGDKPILDTPYSIHVMSSELMENMDAGTSDQLIRYNPMVQPFYSNASNGYTSSMIRGFNQLQISLDGIPLRNAVLGSNMDDIERMEVLSGASAFLYGSGGSTGGLAGTVNMVTKRPTETPMANVTVGNYGGEQYYVKADLGGPIDKEGKFGYRLVAAHQDGDNPVSLGLKRTVVSGALDWKVTDSFKASINVAHTNYKRTGSGGLTVSIPATSTKVPSANDFDNTRPPTPNWGVNHYEVKRVHGSIQWDIDDDTTLRAAALYRKEERKHSRTAGGLAIQADGTYAISFLNDVGPVNDATGGYLYLDRQFDTFGIQHKVTLGANFNKYKQLTYPDSRSTWNSTFLTLEEALHFPEPTFGPVGLLPKKRASEMENTNILIGDYITINQHFLLLAGLNHATIDTTSYNTTTGAVTSSYKKSALTPSVSLLFKPISRISLYATYMENLENAGTVSMTNIPPFTNAGEIMKPTVSKQTEIGVKRDVYGTLLTLALFRIDRANLYNVDNGNGTLTRTQDGRQIHKGVELTATGKVTDNLTIMGGGYYLDPKTTKTNSTANLGKDPAGVARWRGALWAEYRLPFQEKLFLTGGVSHIGRSYYNATNTIVIPSYTFGDVGLRHESTFFGRPTTLRFNVQNVTNERYWGYAAAQLFLGSPRTYTFSVTSSF